LAATLRLESRVEKIVRRRTWAVVTERCGGGNFAGDGVVAAGREGWEVALDKWREGEMRRVREKSWGLGLGQI
jgi:NAD(P)H-hydrate repair Nnr-like enzyme with NAD(P)H-hydrate epimerase domain